MPDEGIHQDQGPLTQEVEYLPFKQRVVGLNPARPTKKESWKKAVNLWKRKVGCFSLLLMDLWPMTPRRSITFSVSKFFDSLCKEIRHFVWLIKPSQVLASCEEWAR